MAKDIKCVSVSVMITKEERKKWDEYCAKNKTILSDLIRSSVATTIQGK